MEKMQCENTKRKWMDVLTCCFIAIIPIALNSCQTTPVPPFSLEFVEASPTPKNDMPGNVSPEIDIQPNAKTGFPVTFAWMSDTQGYSEQYPEIFTAMTKWIVNERDARNIQYVLHTGDVVDNYDDTVQWDNANNALSILNSEVPLLVTAGNHDIDGVNLIYEFYLKFFGEKRFEALPSFGGAYQNGRGRYDLINIGEVPTILLSVGYGMGYGVDDNAIDWLNEVLQQYSDRFAILCFHSYLDPDGSLTTDGEVLFEEIVKKNQNVGLVLCGHRHGVNHTAVQLDDNLDGTPERTVYQLVADYQDAPKSGGGYLVLLTFDSTERTISVKTYSPYLDDYNCYEDKAELEEFVLPWEFH